MRVTERNRYGAQQELSSRTFICTNAPEAKHVRVVGDFNKWNRTSHPMTQGVDKGWSARIALKHGHHRYAFLVDGERVLDPTAMGITRDDHGERVSHIAVS